MSQSTILLLCGGGLILAFIAVIIDRLNFPQRRFVARGTRVDGRAGPTRDRTGAHIVTVETSPSPESERPTRDHPASVEDGEG